MSRPVITLRTVYDPLVLLFLGLVLILGGDKRFSAPAFRYQRLLVESLTPHPPLLWGVIAVVLACGCIFAGQFSFKFLLIGLVLTSCYYICWAVLFVFASTTPTVAYTGIVAYSALGGHGLISAWDLVQLNRPVLRR
jgi:hypothetical protein